jgi:hypothetical protein
MMSRLAVGWLLLDQAVIAVEKGAKLPENDADRAFYDGKRYAGQYFARNVLPQVESSARVLALEDGSAMDIPDAAFATE